MRPYLKTIRTKMKSFVSHHGEIEDMVSTDGQCTGGMVDGDLSLKPFGDNRWCSPTSLI